MDVRLEGGVRVPNVGDVGVEVDRAVRGCGRAEWLELGGGREVEVEVRRALVAGVATGAASVGSVLDVRRSCAAWDVWGA